MHGKPLGSPAHRPFGGGRRGAGRRRRCPPGAPPRRRDRIAPSCLQHKAGFMAEETARKGAPDGAVGVRRWAQERLPACRTCRNGCASQLMGLRRGEPALEAQTCHVRPHEEHSQPARRFCGLLAITRVTVDIRAQLQAHFSPVHSASLPRRLLRLLVHLQRPSPPCRRRGTAPPSAPTALARVRSPPRLLPHLLPPLRCARTRSQTPSHF